jgi:hypothetical protein
MYLGLYLLSTITTAQMNGMNPGEGVAVQYLDLQILDPLLVH